MKNLFYHIFLLFISLGCAFGQSQNPLTLTFEQYLDIVKEHHPLAVVADLKASEGVADVQRARGAFDPKAYAGFNGKRYLGEEYYSIGNAGLKIPTWYGIEIQAGFEDNGGTYLNPERTVPADGLAYGGISWTLGQGLVIDKRRTELRKADIYLQVTEQERRQMLNKLLFDAGKAYWDWFEAYYDVRVFEEAVDVARERLEAVKQSAEAGDRPNIDTLEAGIQVQNRQLLLQENQLKFKNATQFLSVYIWSEGQIPLELDDQVLPEDFDEILEIVSLTEEYEQKDSVLASHPKLLAFSGKIEQMRIQQRLQREMLKPVVNFKYNLLSNRELNEFGTGLPNDNYIVGLEFSMPVFLRKERGELKLADIKIGQAENELKFGRQNLGFRVDASRNKIETTRNQVELYSQTVLDYEGLLNGEKQKFEAGESSLFLVNARETGYIGARIKLIQLVSKNRKADLESEFYIGRLHLN